MLFTLTGISGRAGDAVGVSEKSGEAGSGFTSTSSEGTAVCCSDGVPSIISSATSSAT